MKRQLSLKTLLLSAFLPVVILPILLVALATQSQYHTEIRSVEANIEQDLLITARAREKILTVLLVNAVDQARFLASAWPDLDGRSNRVLADFTYRSHAFSQVWVVSRQGQVRFSSDPAAIGRTIASEPYWQVFTRTGEITYSASEEEVPGRRVIRIVLPISPQEALVATYGLAQLQNAIRDPQTIQLKRYAYIVDQHGRVIAHPDERVWAERRDLSVLPPVQAAMAGRSGTMVYRDPFTGQERSAVYFPMGATGWAVIASQPSASTMLVSPMVANQRNLLILAAGLVLAVWMTAMLSRRLASPVEEFSRRLKTLTTEPIRPGQAEVLTMSTGIIEYRQVSASAQALYEALAQTIATLEARTSELKLTNEQLETSVEALKRLDHLRADFLNALSHDLRIPLTSIIGYAELLQDAQEPPLGASEQEYVTHVIEACHRMENMLEELLDYARLEVGRIKLNIEPVDAYALLDETFAFFRPLAEQKQIALHAELPEDLPEVMVDPDRLRQILNNLISNAIKYTPPGGAITVRACLEGPCVAFEVQDTGYGLSDEDKQHLFEKFYRSSRPEIQHEKGSGIGLALIKGVIEAHEGHIEVESKLGKGSLFRFTLPAAEAAVPSAAPRQESEAKRS
ncbi:MAG TPA: sensor histidine kinase [Stenomitos sp.]